MELRPGLGLVENLDSYFHACEIRLKQTPKATWLSGLCLLGNVTGKDGRILRVVKRSLQSSPLL